MAAVYNGGMKKWLLCSVAVLFLAAAGTLAWTLRPAWEEGSHTDYTAAKPVPLPLQTADAMALNYRWQLGENPPHTLLLGDADAVDMLEPLEPWEVSLTFGDGSCKLRSSAPHPAAKDKLSKTDSRFYVAYTGQSLLRMPNGGTHIQYHFALAAEISITPSWWQQEKKLILLQELIVDPTDKAADLVTPRVPASMAHLPVQQVVSGKAAALPARFCGTAAEQALERYLFRMATLRSAEAVADQLPMLQSKAEELAELYTDPELPWPDCWGRAADKAQENARRVIPILQQLQEEDCYGSQELADFINSPLFARIFGN